MLVCAQGASAAALSNRPDRTIAIDGTVNAIATNGGRAFFGGDFTGGGFSSGPATQFDAANNSWVNYGQAAIGWDGGTPLVSSVVSDGKGGWYAAGFFGSMAQGDSTFPRVNVVHLSSGAQVDPTFGAGVDTGEIYALAYDLASDTLYMSGSFTKLNGNPQPNLAAVDGATGNFKPSFTPTLTGGAQSVYAMTLSNGSLYVGGSFTQVNSTALANAAKLDMTTGAPDATWDPDPDNNVTALAAGTGTDIFIGGQFTNVDDTTGTQQGATPRLAHVDAAGGADTAFNPAPDQEIDAIATDGTHVWVGGPFTTIDGAGHLNLAELLASDGSATAGFPEADSPVQDLLLDGTDLYVGGAFTHVGGAAHQGLARIDTSATPTPTVDPTFTQSTSGTVYSLAFSNDPSNPDALYAGGSFFTVDAVPRTRLLELDLDNGTLAPIDISFDGAIRAMAMINGVLYVGGAFTHVDDGSGSVARSHSAAIDLSTGKLDPTWDPPFDGDVLAITQGFNGTVLFGGAFATSPAAFAAAIIEVGQPGAGSDSGWDGNVAGGQVNAVLAAGAHYYLGGAFTSVGGQARAGLSASDPTTGAVDLNWDPNPNGPVQALSATQPGVVPPFLYAGGNYNTVKGVGRNNLAAIPLADGTGTGTPSSWNPDVDGEVRALAVTPSGMVVAGGAFDFVNGVRHQRVAVIDPGTALPASWAPQVNGFVNAVTVNPVLDERVYTGGTFTTTVAGPVAGLGVWSEPIYVRSGAVTIDDPVSGQSTNCNDANYGGSGPYTEQTLWKLDGVDIPGSLGFFSWTPTDADVGHQLTCYVLMNNMGHTSSFTSAPKTVAARPVSSGASGSSGGSSPPPPPTTASPSAPTVPPDDIDGQLTPPPPVVTKSVIAEPSRGPVTVLLPGAARPVPLPDAERIPTGTIIDVTKGRVTLTTVGAGGKLQTADFYGGVFGVTQAAGARPMVTLALARGDFKVCPKISRTRKSGVSAKKRKTVAKTKSIRHLWGEGAGLFRTQGRYASATIRGTTWLTDDRCDGTLVRVKQGAVTVRDLPKSKSLILKAPKSYLARAK